MLMVTVSALLGPGEAWLIRLIALCSILVGSGLIFLGSTGWRAGRRPPTGHLRPVLPPVVLGELDSEAAAVLRLMRAYVDAQE